MKGNLPKNPGYPPTLAGGDPVWVQAPEHPSCPKCRKPMHFILQLSSDSLDTHLRNKDLADQFEIAIEYYATLYYFECEECPITCSVTQCT